MATARQLAIEIGEAVLFVVIGLVIGIAVIFIVMQSRITKRSQQLFDARKQEIEAQLQQRNQEINSQLEQRKNEMDGFYKTQYTAELDKWKAEYEPEVMARIKKECDKALSNSRSSLKGKATEQLAPFLPEFASKYIAGDARFLGTPVDLIVFKNLHTWSSTNGSEPQPIEIVFIEVKAGNSSTLNRNERAVKAAVDNLRVKYELLNIPLNNNNSRMTDGGPTSITRTDTELS